ncbi:hypothetical protein EGJ00_14975 [Pseudomonas saudiphocaensis]|nr:hypothetical protein EGJ00_14975 [Pseudomonas saudiphocaensis]
MLRQQRLDLFKQLGTGQQIEERIGIRMGCEVMRTALLKDGGLAPRIHMGCSLGSVCFRNYHRRPKAL